VSQQPIWEPGDEQSRDPEFLLIGQGSKVHVLHHWQLPGTWATGIAQSIFSKPVARCGARQRSLIPAMELWVRVFDDAELCTRCLASVPVEHQHRLFEHEIPWRHPDAESLQSDLTHETTSE
jgi:hypothetical protein